MFLQNLRSFEGFRAVHTCRSFELKAQRSAQVYSPDIQIFITSMFGKRSSHSVVLELEQLVPGPTCD